MKNHTEVDFFVNSPIVTLHAFSVSELLRNLALADSPCD